MNCTLTDEPRLSKDTEEGLVFDIACIRRAGSAIARPSGDFLQSLQFLWRLSKNTAASARLDAPND